MSIFKKKAVSMQNVVYGDDLDFTTHESYRLLRTNLIFSFAGEHQCRIVGVTSTMKGEGKTTTSINLSFVLAENDAKVCLVEADMRMPTIGKRLQLKGTVGLSELLTGQITLDESIQKKEFKKCTLNVITAGRIPPNPAELLNSAKMKQLLEELREKFDYVIFDFPPIDVVADSLIVGVLIDGMILSVAEGIVKKKQVQNTMRQLRMTRIKLLGFVRTFTTSDGFRYKKRRYRSYYGHYRTKPQTKENEVSVQNANSQENK